MPAAAAAELITLVVRVVRPLMAAAPEVVAEPDQTERQRPAAAVVGLARIISEARAARVS